VQLCPVCWSRRRIQERGEIVFAGGLWLASGAGLASHAVTVPHSRWEPLETVTDRLEAFARSMRVGYGWRQLQELGVVGILRANEVTWSAKNGWHPHQHWLLWTDGPPECARIGEWFRKWRDRWRRKHWEKQREEPYYVPEHDPYINDPSNIEPADLNRIGGHTTKGPSRSTIERYYKARRDGEEDLERYLAPFVLGDLAADGDVQALAAWREYEQTVAGSQWLRWPNGFRARFGFGEAGKQPALEGELVAVVKQGTNPRDEYLSGRGGLDLRGVSG